MADSHKPRTDCADRRRAARVADAQGETVLVWVEGCPPQTAVFLDESHLGIGVAFQEDLPLKIGQRVEVVFRGTAQASLVSSLRSYHDVVRVGLQWIDAAEPECNPHARA
jgi:hypothetical protein